MTTAQWQDEFDAWQNSDIEQFDGELKWKDANCSAHDGFMEAKRQDAERIAELEAAQKADAYLEQRLTSLHAENAELRAELRAKRLSA